MTRESSGSVFCLRCIRSPHAQDPSYLQLRRPSAEAFSKWNGNAQADTLAVSAVDLPPYRLAASPVVLRPGTEGIGGRVFGVPGRLLRPNRSGGTGCLMPKKPSPAAIAPPPQAMNAQKAAGCRTAGRLHRQSVL